MKIGDKVSRAPDYGTGENPSKRETGKVVYIHPAGRYYTVEFEFVRAGRSRSFRQSWSIEHPEKKPEEPGNDTEGARGLYFGDLEKKRQKARNKK